MTIDTSVQFHQRPPSSSDYCFEIQRGIDHCVFASIAGAVNHLARSVIWSSDSLAFACKSTGIVQQTFDSVWPIAREPCKDTVEGKIYRDTETEKNPDRFLNHVIGCVMGGGVAILSLEQSRTAPKKVDRMANYHMITLYKMVPGGFDVWDTYGKVGQITLHEAKVGFAYDESFLVSHPEFECLLLNKRKPS